VARIWFRQRIDYLPKVMISPKRIAEENIVMMRAKGVDMARKTGPFFSRTHACK
jgi:hypothetical protein